VRDHIDQLCRLNQLSHPNQLNQLSQLNPAQSNSTITHKTEESFTPPTAEHTSRPPKGGVSIA